MTQLQQIADILSKLDKGALLLAFWKKSFAEGKQVDALYSMKVEVKQNYEWVAAITSELFAQMILQFNPVTEAEIMLGDLHLLWQAPKDFRNFSAIRKMIHDIEMLYKIAEL